MSIEYQVPLNDNQVLAVTLETAYSTGGKTLVRKAWKVAPAEERELEDNGSVDLFDMEDFLNGLWEGE